MSGGKGGGAMRHSLGGGRGGGSAERTVERDRQEALDTPPGELRPPDQRRKKKLVSQKPWCCYKTVDSATPAL